MADLSTLRSLDLAAMRGVLETLGAANDRFALRYPGDRGDRQPVHVVYGGAHLFKADTVPKLGVIAARALGEYAASPRELAAILELPGHAGFPGRNGERIDFPGGDPTVLARRVYERVQAKLSAQAVEDYRIDFEDGFGFRPDAEEDHHAIRGAGETAAAWQAGTLPPFFGLRIKSFTRELAERAIRTLDLYLSALVAQLGPTLPANFVVTLPKVTLVEQVEALVAILEQLEAQLKLPAGSLKLEIMVETPQAIADSQGRCPLPAFVEAARGRCVAAHFGTYDYTAACEITAQHQAMRHPACDHARHAMQVALAGSGVRLSDGATNVLPIAPHRAAAGSALSANQVQENRLAVNRAWKLHFDDTMHSLRHGFYQGWDLHPAQLVSRYAALYTFFTVGLEAATARLSNFIEKAAQATRVGEVFDDAASGQGLLNFFLRGVACGALSEAEAQAAGVSLEDLRGRSFMKILENRSPHTFRKEES